jgi:phytoene dehydrogenase-like protein
MARVAPGDREAIREFTDGVRALRGFPMEVLAPRELVGLREGLRMLWSMRSGLLPMWRYGMSVAEFARRFSSPVLRRFVEHVFVPEMPAMFAMVVLAQLADGRLGGYRGGSLAFARAVERRYAGLGGEIACRSRVAKVLVENDRAVGVRLADGTEHHADVVVSAADGRSTIFDLLGGKYVDSAIRDRYARWPLFRPLVQASWGVADPLADREHSGAIFLGEPIRYGPLSCAGFHYRICNYDPSLAPPGKTVVQVLMETEWDWWAKLREDKAAYAAEKERLAAALFDRLSRHLPAAAGKVDVTDVATPYTFWRYTLNQRGAYEGWLPTVEATKASVARTLPGLGSFHMVGQWVTPGGGVPPALFIGRHLLQELCRAERRPFTASVP